MVVKIYARTIVDSDVEQCARKIVEQSESEKY
jgi:hypothetical protein